MDPMGNLDWQNKAKYGRFGAFNLRQKLIGELKKQQQEIRKDFLKSN
jgi:hypothetical protein